MQRFPCLISHHQQYVIKSLQNYILELPFQFELLIKRSQQFSFNVTCTRAPNQTQLQTAIISLSADQTLQAKVTLSKFSNFQKIQISKFLKFSERAPG